MIANNGPCKVEPARDTPEVMRAIEELREVVQRHDDLVGRLCDRLRCVVVQSEPVPIERSDKKPPYQTELAVEISSIRCQIRDITDSLESMYYRIEL